MKISWVGTGRHTPSASMKCSYYKGFLWQIKNGCSFPGYLSKLTHTISSADRYEIDDADILIMTWNPREVDEQTYKLLLEIERQCVARGVEVLNPISKMKLIKQKHAFFEAIEATGVSPSYYMPHACDDIRLEFPMIVRDDIACSGKNTFLVKDEYEFKDAYTILDKLNCEILAVEYKDSYDSEINAHIASRVFFFCNTITFSYINISEEKWCLHCRNTGEYKDKEGYIKSCYKTKDVITKNMRLFKDIQKAVGLDIFALDFMLSKGKLYILEAELKYGPDDNYYRYHHKRYRLTDAFYKDMCFGLNISNRKEFYEKLISIIAQKYMEKEC